MIMHWLVIVIVLCGAVSGLNKRLAVHDYLDSAKGTRQFEFPATISKQLHILSKPVSIYGELVEQITIYSNGFIVLSNHSTFVPEHYPTGTAQSLHRLGNLEGEFMGVFTTPNQCSKSGRVQIRELIINKGDNDSCALRHVERINREINLAFPEDDEFEADYLLSIAWIDMGCASGENPTRNSFTLLLIAGGQHTYAVFQYNKIEWTLDPTKGSLPAEAGIFIKAFDTPQLPRSNLYSEASNWNDESNVAVGGEWILPLRPSIFNADTETQSKIRILTEEFMEKSYNLCFETQPKPVKEIREVDRIERSAQILTKITNSEYNSTPETGILADSSYLEPIDIKVQRTTSPNDESVFERCSSNSCNDTVAECFLLNEASCCVCPANYYGSGSVKCWSIGENYSRRFYFAGRMSSDFTGLPPTIMKLNVFLDVEVNTNGEIIAQSGVNGIPKSSDERNSAHMVILTPVFHLLNSLFSLPPKACRNIERIYNPFTVAGGFKSPFQISINLEVEGHGKLRIEVSLKLEDTNIDPQQGYVNINVTEEGRFTSVGEQLAIKEESKVEKLIEYKKFPPGRIGFSGPNIILISPDNTEMVLQWSALGSVSDNSDACVLDRNNLLPDSQKQYILFSEQGYCYYDCRSEDGCSYYCLDMPTIHQNKPDACSCIQCPHEDEHCVVDGQSHRCECKIGFEKVTGGGCMPINTNLRSEPTNVCNLPLEQGLCDAHKSRFGFRSGRCVQFIYGGCGGNENNFASEEECRSVCHPVLQTPPQTRQQGRADICNLPLIQGRCRAYIPRFGFNTESGRCESFVYGGCDGNANSFNTEADCISVCVVSVARDRCTGVRCGYNARCVDGECSCDQGYVGDPLGECRLENAAYKSRYEEGDVNICSLPFEQGMCVAYIPSYGFNFTSGRCELFIYGGCGGNQNRFETEAQCMSVCFGASRTGTGSQQGMEQMSRCNLPFEQGRCRAYIPRYGFNATIGRCEQFIYGGCDGNDNSFETEDNCMSACAGAVKIEMKPTATESQQTIEKPGICNLPFEQGRCRAYIPRYGFNAASGRCEQFIYGGCDGNGNSFATEDDCMSACAGVVKIATESGRANEKPGICNLPFEQGRCRAYIPRYGFNAASGRCEQFIYGGCDGNENSFETEDDCKSACTAESKIEMKPITTESQQTIEKPGICNLPFEQGRCRAYIPRYGFNAASGRCEQFIYGGCDGNENSFETEDDCKSACTAESKIDYCTRIQCGYNARCKEGRCLCEDGFSGDPNRECRRDERIDILAPEATESRQEIEISEICKLPLEQGGCRAYIQRFGYNSTSRKCEMFIYGGCGGNENSFESKDACLQACSVASTEDDCAAISCGYNARCVRGRCVCEDGFRGDPDRECRPEERDEREHDLCQQVRCGSNAECENGQCFCLVGFVGDPQSKCLPVEKSDLDLCSHLMCAENSECDSGLCQCKAGYLGDGFNECNPLEAKPDNCENVICGSNAFCVGAKCYCSEGYTGDAYRSCQKTIIEEDSGDISCRTLQCHENATCLSGDCQCNPGFAGDGFIDCWPTDPANVCDCRGMPVSIAGCSDGKCRCLPGYKMRSDGHCEECRGNSECAENANCEYDYDAQHYRCDCSPGYIGDGALACIDRSIANGSQPAQCRIPCHKYGTCDSYSDRCRCRQGFRGNGYTYCDFDCSQCRPDARCSQEENRCFCPPDYIGDGIKYCRPVQGQGSLKLEIERKSDILHIVEGSSALNLVCRLTGDVQNVAMRWLTPGDAGIVTETIDRDVKRIHLSVKYPDHTHSGRYVCQAGGITDNIHVVVEKKPEDVSRKIFLTSDNGILSVRTKQDTPLIAQIWHIAEKNYHARVAIGLDCRNKRLFYTSDQGNALRWGNSSSTRLDSLPQIIHRDSQRKFTWLAADPTSGNLFAVDDMKKQIVVLHPGQINKIYTFKELVNDTEDHEVVIAGIAVHPRLSLIYWAQSLSGTESQFSIKVAKMWNGETVDLLRLTGIPVVLSLAVAQDEMTSITAGRICWLQRRQLLPFPRNELYCAELSSDGLRVQQKRLMKSFDGVDEPSHGLTQDDDSILWTLLYRSKYESINPSKSIQIKGVCCSNGFQSILIEDECKRALTNTCSFDNGRCRHFCLPGGQDNDRFCKCPDDQPNCAP